MDMQTVLGDLVYPGWWIGILAAGGFGILILSIFGLVRKDWKPPILGIALGLLMWVASILWVPQYQQYKTIIPHLVEMQNAFDISIKDGVIIFTDRVPADR